MNDTEIRTNGTEIKNKWYWNKNKRYWKIATHLLSQGLQSP